MGNGQNLIDKIISDAKKEAEGIVAASQKEADNIIKEAENAARLEEKRLNALSDNEAQKAAAKEISSAEMRARQLILKQKRQCLDDIIDEAENYLCSLSGQEYEDTIFKMLKNSEYGQGCEVILSKRDKEAMEEKLKDMGYNVSGETRDIEGGFVVKKGDIEYNYSFKSMIMVQREEISYLASEILFP